MEDKMITVPYGDFVDGIQAMADLDSIRAMVNNGSAYCSSDIMAVLGLEEKDDGTDREQNAD